MDDSRKKEPGWVTRGKNIRQLIAELKTFENQDLLVEISTDDGKTHKPISMVVKRGGLCILKNCETQPGELK